MFGSNSDGELLVLLGKTDALDKNSINLKLGYLRIALEPNPFVSGGFFPRSSTICIKTSKTRNCTPFSPIESTESASPIWI